MKKTISKSEKIKIFCDTADINEIKKMNKNLLVEGFTTNPSLMKQAGAKNYISYSKRILKICNKKPISFEVFANDEKNMLLQARKINKWGKNVYVKIPIINTKGMFMGNVIKKLSDDGIKLNITAIYTAQQVSKVLKKLNKSSHTILSIFSGRMADVGKDPIAVIKKSISISKKFKNVKILWASTREPYNYIQAKQCNCAYITIPPRIIEKISQFGKTYNSLTLDTVKKFYKDAKDANYKL